MSLGLILLKLLLTLPSKTIVLVGVPPQIDFNLTQRLRKRSPDACIYNGRD